LASVFAAIALAGCGRPTATASDVVARLGEHEVSYSDFEDYLRINSLESEIGLASAVLSGLFDQFLLEELLLQSAREQGIDTGDRRRVVERMVDRRVAAVVAEDTVEAYYREHPEEFNLPERVSFRQILTADRDQASEALARIQAGEPFEEVARSVQEDEEMGGWEQSGLTRSTVPPAFADAIFSLDEGDVSEIVEAEYGFLLFEVTRHQPQEQLAIESAAPRIRRKLEREAADRALSELAAEAAQRYNVAVFEQNLPFDYQGNY
jgi:parvulin-like peptidyl-prolyl isomerase